MLLSRKLLSRINENFAQINNIDLTSALNSIGIEVEQVIQNKVHENLKLAKLIKVSKHPNSDKLSLCEVVHNNKKYNIVCGAPNLKINQWVILATPGTILGNGIEISTRQVHGQESEGMLCSIHEVHPQFSDLLTDEDKDSILQIPMSIKLNPETFFDDFGFNDTVFDLSIPSNRPELNGAYYLAYELNLQFKFTTKLPSNKLPILSLRKKSNEELSIKVTKGLDKYYLAQIDISYDYEEILKLKFLYLNCGITLTKSINHSNLITLLFAQPVVIFSAKNVSTKVYVVEIEEDEEFNVSLTQTIKLKKGTIVTKTNNQIISVTGMQVSYNFATTYDDKKIFIEIANFTEQYATNFKKHNILNNYANYFIKGSSDLVAKMTFDWSLNNSWFQLDEKPVIYHSDKVKKTKSIFIKSYKDLLRLLGVKLSIIKLNYIFSRIGIKFLIYKAIIPSYRIDLNNINDLVEEILKYIDINKLESKPIKFEINNFRQNDIYNRIDLLRNYLINKQFYEVKTYNLTSESKLNNFNWFNINERIEIENPISNERKYLRNNLVNEMLDVLTYNVQHKQNLLNIFEIQKIHFSTEKSNNILCCLLNNDIFKNSLNKNIITSDLYSIKAIYEGLEDALGFKLRKKYDVENFNNIYTVNNFSLFNKTNEFVGIVGQLKKNFLHSKFKLNQDVYFICLNLDLAFDNKKPKHSFWEISELNPIYKDITFYNPNNIDLKDVVRNIVSTPMITSANLKDVYTNDENVKSYTFTLKIQPNNKNLTAVEISNIFNSVIENLKNQKLVIKDRME